MAVRKSDVLAAFERIRTNGIGWNRASTKWDVIDPLTGERFPPKAVLRIAKEIAGDRTALAGGGWPTNDPLEALGFEIALKPHLETSEVAADVKRILGSDTDETTKQRLINARLGQGGFREALLEIWQSKCSLTGCQIGPVLRASHIKAWRASDNAERLDPHNGLLLAASIDALFDKHLLTFAPTGVIRLAASIDREAVVRLGLKKGTVLALSDRSQAYMKWHRQESESVVDGGFIDF